VRVPQIHSHTPNQRASHAPQTPKHAERSHGRRQLQPSEPLAGQGHNDRIDARKKSRP
ncbi:uncharacterized protein METZ01_LOCUS66222, partial [marine metagenome]